MIVGLAATSPLHDGVSNDVELERSEEERAVWFSALASLTKVGSGTAWRSKVYERGFNWLLEQRRMPTRSDLNSWLSSTGWRVEYTQGYLNVSTYQRLLSANICPVTQRIRKLRDIKHSAAPDFLHDVVGHLPLLFDPQYGDLLREWGAKGTRILPTDRDREVDRALADLIDVYEAETVNSDSVKEKTDILVAAHINASEHLSRYARLENFYTWAIEFGMVQRGNAYELIGAAALSSTDELLRIKHFQVGFAPFRENAIERPVNYTRFQDNIFIASSFQEYFDELRKI